MNTTAFYNKVKQMFGTHIYLNWTTSASRGIHFILLSGLDNDNDPLVAIVSSHDASDYMLVSDVYVQLLHTEQRMEARRAEGGVDLHASYNYVNKSGGGKSLFQASFHLDQRTPMSHKSPN
jgi:hypothetical protein